MSRPFTSTAAGFAVLCLTVFMIGAARVAAADQDPQAVTLFTGASFSGAQRTWRLGEEDYLAVPYLGEELSHRVGSLKVGADVGAMLFQRPHFASRDAACGPGLGSDERPDLWWRGLTVSFAPPAAGRGTTFEAASLDDGSYASLILYRRDLGPPAGALLLEPRLYYNRACTEPRYANYYSRIFIPAVKVAAGQACINLSAPSQSPGAGDNPPRLTRTERLLLMSADMLDEGYPDNADQLAVILFDKRDCQGEVLRLAPASDEQRDFDLVELGFRHRARSVRAVYGAAGTDPVPTAQRVHDAPPLETAAPAAGGGAQPSRAGPSEGKQTGSAAAQVAVTRAPPLEAGSKDLRSAEPPAAAPADEGLSRDREPAEKPRAPAVETAVATPPITESDSQSKTFRFPVHGDFRLNYCYEMGKRCGEPAAQAWCEAQGFATAASWKRDANVGGLFPTIVIGEDRICARYLCDGFEEITCSP